MGAKPHDLQRREKGDTLKWTSRTKRHADFSACCFFWSRARPGERAPVWQSREQARIRRGALCPGTGACGLDGQIFDPIRFSLIKIKPQIRSKILDRLKL